MPDVIDPSQVRDIAPEVLTDQGRPRILPAAYWATTTAPERALLGHRHGLYSLPTTELVEHLRGLIADRSAIEIGAGNGVLAEALGIPATDSRQQERPECRTRIMINGQRPVRYGPNVIHLDAHAAVRHYRPDIVIGCWVTHRYDPRRHWAGGNEIGVAEEDVIRRCRQYVLVGNEMVHAAKSIWRLPHRVEYPSWLVSRAINGSRDFIAVWRGDRARGARRG